MTRSGVIRKNRYFDSVFLMQVRQRLEREPGVKQAVAAMGTGNNKQLLVKLGFAGPWAASAGPNDLIVAVEGESLEAVRSVLGRVEEFLARKAREQGGHPRTLAAGLAMLPSANLAVISVPGRYVAREARTALERGLSVFLFSSNVVVEDELALKTLARERGLLVMGPDCGTAIVGGIGIGFANVVRRGSIGVIGSSGTGIQEFTCRVHRAGHLPRHRHGQPRPGRCDRGRLHPDRAGCAGGRPRNPGHRAHIEAPGGEDTGQDPGPAPEVPEARGGMSPRRGRSGPEVGPGSPEFHP